MKSILALLIASLAFASSLSAQTAHHFGWKSNPHHSKHLTQLVHAPFYSTVSVPDVVDLSGVMPGGPAPLNAQHMPPVYDQGQLGSCTANAGTASIEFRWHWQHNTFIPGSRLGLYTCSTIHDGSWPQDAGSMTATVVWVLQNQGIGLEKLFPYNTASYGKPLPKTYLPNAASQKAVHAYDVASSDHISIMVAISKGYPVMYGGYVYNSIEGLTATNYFNPPHKGSPIGGHERLIVGYNRKLAHKVGSKTITGWYWVRNSWSEQWGYKGYCYEPMADVENPAINEDFAVVDLTK